MFRGAISERCWLLLADGTDPTICLEDPLIDQDRYLYVEADTTAMYPIARGTRGWSEAIADGSVQVYGEPKLIREMPTWFKAVEKAERASEAAAAVA